MSLRSLFESRQYMISSTSKTGAWIFVSYSNKDIEKVRNIRNLLERRGDNPVLFFLKCMENTEADDRLLWDLIEREIKARTFFLLCDSPNAQNSTAVQREKDLAESMLREGKVIIPIDLEKVNLTNDELLTDFDTIQLNVAVNMSDEQIELQKVIQLAKRATVFLSYSHSDHVLATRIGDTLRNNDYGVWTNAELRPGENWAGAIGAAIDEAVQHGFVLLLLTKASLDSQFCRHETFHAFERAAASGRSNVVPVIADQFDRFSLPRELQSIQWFDLTTGPFEERMEELIRNLKTREME